MQNGQLDSYVAKRAIIGLSKGIGNARTMILLLVVGSQYFNVEDVTHSTTERKAGLVGIHAKAATYERGLKNDR